MLSTMPMLTQSLAGFVVLRFSTLGLCSPCKPLLAITGMEHS